VISLEEALRNADSPNEVRLMIKLAEQGGLDDLGASLEGLTLESTDDGRKMR
jgi:twitching motility protein PilU